MPTPTGRSGKSLNFFLNLYDGMSKPVEKINKAYNKMSKIFQGKYKKAKDSVKAFSDATKQGVDRVKNLGSTTYNSLSQIQMGYDELIGKALDSIRVIKDSLEDFLGLAIQVNDMMIVLNKNVGLVSKRSKQFHTEILNMGVDYRTTFDELQEILESTYITQFRNTKQLAKFVEAVNMLSVATGISRSEAAETFEVYTKFYKGGYRGFLRLANVIRFTTATTKLAQREATGLVESFVEVVKNLPQKYRSQAAKEVLAIGGAAKEAEVDLGDLQRAFSQITTKWNEQGIRLRAFLAQNTKASIKQVERLVETGNFTKVFELMAKASKKLSKEQFMLMRQDFEALTGMSFDMARQLREFDITQLNKTMQAITRSSKRTKDISDAFEQAKSSMHELWKDLKSSLAPFLAGVLRPILLEVVKVMRELRPEVQAFGKWLIQKIPFVSSILLKTFRSIVWAGEKVYEFWQSLSPEIQESIKYGALFAAAFAVMAGVVIPVIVGIAGAFLSLFSTIAPLVGLGIVVYESFKWMKKGIADVLGVAPEALTFFETLKISWETLRWAGCKVVEQLKAMWEWISNVGKAIKDSKIVQFAGKLGDFAGSAAKTGVSAIGKGLSYINPFADGGIVTGPVNALIGEGKHNEAILPLNHSMLSNVFGDAFEDTVKSIISPYASLSTLGDDFEDAARMITSPYANLSTIPTTSSPGSISQPAPKVSVNVHQEKTNKILLQILQTLKANGMMNKNEEIPHLSTGLAGEMLENWST